MRDARDGQLVSRAVGKARAVARQKRADEALGVVREQAVNMSAQRDGRRLWQEAQRHAVCVRDLHLVPALKAQQGDIA